MGIEILQSDPHVWSIVFNTPGDNYLDTALVSAIADALDTLDEDSDCRVVVLRSTGKNFCAGARLSSDVQAPGPRLYDQVVRMVDRRKPMIAAVQGAAVGAGLGLALTADFRVGSPATRMVANFARLGFHHGFGLSATLPEAVGTQAALDLLLTGRRVKGDEAYRLGLLDRYAEQPQDLDSVVHDLAQDLSRSAPLAVQSMRATITRDRVARIRQATDLEEQIQQTQRHTQDRAEGIRAYSERRLPDFKGL